MFGVEVLPGLGAQVVHRALDVVLVEATQTGLAQHGSADHGEQGADVLSPPVGRLAIWS